MKLIFDHVDSSMSLLYNISANESEAMDLSMVETSTLAELRTSMEEVELSFSDQLLRNPAGCEYTEGLTPWNEPALILFCNETGTTAAPTGTTAPTQAPCITDADCGDPGILFCAMVEPATEVTNHCYTCSGLDVQCGARRPPCCNPLQCKISSVDGKNYCVVAPTAPPSASPSISAQPSDSPSSRPTAAPTSSPRPTTSPTASPTKMPSAAPTRARCDSYDSRNPCQASPSGCQWCKKCSAGPRCIDAAIICNKFVVC